MKYNTLNKNEKKNLKINFFKTKEGITLKSRLFRVLIWSILLFLTSIYLIIDASIINYNLLQIIYASVLLIISIAFYIGRYNIIKKNLNSYLVKKR